MHKCAQETVVQGLPLVVQTVPRGCCLGLAHAEEANLVLQAVLFHLHTQVMPWVPTMSVAIIPNARSTVRLSYVDDAGDGCVM